jgi:hypothetical protein
MSRNLRTALLTNALDLLGKRMVELVITCAGGVRAGGPS